MARGGAGEGGDAVTLYTDIDPYCCAVLGGRVEDGSLPPGDVMLADVRHLNAQLLAGSRHVHCFCGIGGLPLGLAWAGWPAAWSVVTGGFPCQDISSAGKGAGLAGKRSGLFWELHRVIGILGPDAFVVENVGALSSRGLDVVAAALESLGYGLEVLRVGAWALGAPHERERWWFVGVRGGIAAAAAAELDPDADGLRAVRQRGAGGEPDGGGKGLQPDAHGIERGGERIHPGQRRPDEAKAHTGGPRAGGVFTDAMLEPGEQSAGHDVQRGRAGEAEHAGVGDGGRRGGCGPITDAGGERCGAGRGDGGNAAGEGGEQRGEPAAGDQLLRHANGGEGREHLPRRESDRGAAAGWAGPCRGPWRRVDDEWQYAGSPVLVYSGGAGRGEHIAAALPGGARLAAGRPDPTRGGSEPGRGWPVPVLPGFVQREWEFPRIHQRGVGNAVHGVSGRMAGSLNKCGVMALGNAVVPQTVAAVAAGLVAALEGRAVA